MFASRSLTIAASLGLAILIPIAANAGQTAFGSAPVSVGTCATDTTIDGPASAYAVPRPQTNLRYRFVNHAGVPAQTVTLAVTVNGETRQITDRGAFAPGVAIDRTIDAFSPDPAGTVACQVTSVDFRDGSSWNAAPAAKVAAR